MDNIERISKLYHSRGSQHSDFSHFKKSPGPRPFWIIGFILAVIFLAAAAGLAGFLIFNQRSEDKAVIQGEAKFLEIQGPEEVSLGQQVDFSVFISNPQEVALTKTELRLILPEGFKLASFDPEPSKVLTNGGIWQLGDIKPSQTKKIVFQGTCFGQFDATQKILAFFNFEPADFTSSFQKEIYFSIKLTEPLLKTSFETPEKLIQGQTGDYSWKIKNITDKPVADIGIIFQYPEGFFVEEDEKPPSSNFLEGTLSNERRWFVENLTPDEEQEIKFRGKILGDGGNWQFKLRAGLIDEEGKFWPEEEKTGFVFLEDAGLTIDLQVTGRVDYKITFKNTASYPIDDLSIELELADKRPFDWNQGQLGKWQWQVGEKVIDGSQWLAAPEKILELGRLAAGQTGLLSFTLNLKSAEELAKLGIKEVDISSQAQVRGKFTPSETAQPIEFEKHSRRVSYSVREKD